MPQLTIVAALNGILNLSRLPRTIHRQGPAIDPTLQRNSFTIDSRVGPRASLFYLEF